MNGAVEKHAALFADAMIKAIEKGTAPWQQPWKRGQDGYPANFKTRRYYSGSNLLLLLAIGIDRGYRSTHWGGFQQIRAAGGQVRKGETGTPILIVRESTRKREGAENVGQMEDEKRNRSIYVTAQHVWNVDQADGVGNEQQEETQEKTAWTTQEAVEAVAADAHIRIIEGANDEAFYKPSTDMINMPPRGAFEQGDGFYHVLLHELGHATAHPSRLDRPEYKTMVSGHGTLIYALEELRAEMSAMMSGARLQVGHSPRHGEAYVANWLSAAGNDPNCIRTAARDAQAMSNWLLRNHAASRQAAPPTALQKAA